MARAVALIRRPDALEEGDRRMRSKCTPNTSNEAAGSELIDDDPRLCEQVSRGDDADHRPPRLPKTVFVVFRPFSTNCIGDAS
jgi:hypothetical protein